MLAKYRNGNCVVTLHRDGTKTREWEGDARPEYPESIDLKITNYCDAACPFCHEQSTTRGIHASLDNIKECLNGLPAGVEIAIGGGNPLSYPHLEELLGWLKEKDYVANLTVHQSHFWDARARLMAWQQAGLVYGIGVSSTEVVSSYGFDDMMPKNLVTHLILGISHCWQELRRAGLGYNILLLGYKQFGRGKKFFSDEITANINQWRYWIGPILARPSGPRISFDNLAIEQLHLRELLPEAVWNRHYMGDDGHFTMYIDAVKDEFAKSSTSDRTPRQGRPIGDMFGLVRGYVIPR